MSAFFIVFSFLTFTVVHYYIYIEPPDQFDDRNN